MLQVSLAVVRVSAPGLGGGQEANLGIEAAITTNRMAEVMQRVEDVVHVPVTIDPYNHPLDVTLNQVLEHLLERDIDMVALSLPGIIAPADFFPSAFLKLYDEWFAKRTIHEPVVAICAPAHGPTGMNVFGRFVDGDFHGLSQLAVNDCLGQAGYVAAPAVGMQTSMFVLEPLKKLSKPHFQYALDPAGLEVELDPGLNFTNKLTRLGFSVLVDYDRWCLTVGQTVHGKPE